MPSSETYTIAFLTTGFPPDVSGVSHFNWERAQWFAQQGHRVVVFAPDWQQSAADLEKERSSLPENLVIERYSSQPWLPYKLTHVPKFRAARQIRKQLAFHRPDIIVMTDVERFFLLSTWQLPGKQYAKQHQIPFLAEYHTDIYNFSAAYPGWQWLRNAARSLRLPNYLYRQFDHTICTSIAASQSCNDLGIFNTQTIPFYGIDVSAYSPKHQDRQCLEQWLSPQEQKNKVLLFLGRLGFEKRVDLLIEAFAKLRHHEPDCSLIIAGDGPENAVNQLKQQAASMDNVHFTGFLFGEMKAKLLASCDVFCSPSPYETFGRCVVEAMASGIPVITVDSGAVSEYISHGENGYLVPPDDVGSLADCINEVISSDNTKVIQSALQVARYSSSEHGCQRLSDYYQQLLNAPRLQPLSSLSGQFQ